MSEDMIISKHFSLQMWALLWQHIKDSSISVSIILGCSLFLPLYVAIKNKHLY